MSKSFLPRKQRTSRIPHFRSTLRESALDVPGLRVPARHSFQIGVHGEARPASGKLDVSEKNQLGTSKEPKIQQTSGNKDDAKPQRDAAKSTDPKQNDVTNAAVRETVTAKHNGVANEDRLISIERQVAEECQSLQSKELTEA